MLFTFPSRYWFAIGHRGVLRLGGWSPRVRTGFHVPRPTRGPRPTLARTGLSPALARRSRRFRFVGSGPLAWSAFARRYWRSLALMSFPPASEIFQFAGFAPPAYGFSRRYRPKGGGLPHSEISGSTGARPSPELNAACHVLHRLSVPRHPPDALQVLDSSLGATRRGKPARGRRRMHRLRPDAGRLRADPYDHPSRGP